jgi:tRNA modification GTPase
MPRLTETIAALATPPGTSAIAVLRVTGPETTRIAEEIFGEVPPSRKVRHADYHAKDGRLVDDILITFFRGPNSYTGEDSLEVSCHGNPFIAQKILEDLFARGCRPAHPGEFTQRAFLSGKMDLSQAEAVMDLIGARSDQALAAANQQLRGALGKQIDSLVDRLLTVQARVEAYIDFPEEDLPPEDNLIIARELDALCGDTRELIATSHYGEMLRDGIKTVIIGAPNVGKSSILNRLVGRERALVSSEPGTTRDFIEERINVGDHLLRIIDTAGLNPSPAPLEKLGMEKTFERAAEADLFLIVLDPTQGTPNLPEAVFARLSRENSIIAANKCDLLAYGAPINIPEELRGKNSPIMLSAKTGAGFDELKTAFSRFAESERRDFGSGTIAINARHAEALRNALESMTAARGKLSTEIQIELLASDIRSALARFGDVIGKIDNEAMLDRLFAGFCIGK